MKVVAAMLLALMLSACDPQLIDYSSGEFEFVAEDSAGTRASLPMPVSLQEPDQASAMRHAPALAPITASPRVAPPRVACLD